MRCFPRCSRPATLPPFANSGWTPFTQRRNSEFGRDALAAMEGTGPLPGAAAFYDESFIDLASHAIILTVARPDYWDSNT